MPLLARFKSLRNTLLNKARLDAEVDAELQSFVAELADRHAAAGMAPAASP